MYSTLLDKNSTDKFFQYNFNSSLYGSDTNHLNLNRLSYNTKVINDPLNEKLINNFNKLLPQNYSKLNFLDFSLFTKIPSLTSVLSAESDSKQYTNNLKYTLGLHHKKKSINNLNYLMGLNEIHNSDLKNTDPYNTFNNSVFNLETNLKFKDYKSSNAQFLGSERTSRLLSNLNSNTYK
jgi:hypothetical protein